MPNQQTKQRNTLKVSKIEPIELRSFDANKKNYTDLNQKQRLFCRTYATDPECMGSGVESYAKVYDIDTSKANWRVTASAGASRLLKSVKISRHINTLLEENGLNDEFADKQLLFLMTQHADLSVKLRAIQEFNRIKGRVVNRFKHSGDSVNPVVVYLPKKNKT